MRVNNNEKSKITEITSGESVFDSKVQYVKIYANDAGSGLFSGRTTFEGRGATLEDAHRDCYNQWHDHFVAEEEREREERLQEANDAARREREEAEREEQRIREEEEEERERELYEERKRRLEEEEEERESQRFSDLVDRANEESIASKWVFDPSEWRNGTALAVFLGTASKHSAPHEIYSFTALTEPEYVVAVRTDAGEYSGSSETFAAACLAAKQAMDAWRTVPVNALELNPARFGFNATIGAVPSCDSAWIDLSTLSHNGDQGGPKLVVTVTETLRSADTVAVMYILSTAYRGREIGVARSTWSEASKALIEALNTARKTDAPSDAFSEAVAALEKSNLDAGLQSLTRAIELNPSFAIELFNMPSIARFRPQFVDLLKSMTADVKRRIAAECSTAVDALTEIEASINDQEDKPTRAFAAFRSKKKDVAEKVSAELKAVRDLAVQAESCAIYADLVKLRAKAELFATEGKWDRLRSEAGELPALRQLALKQEADEEKLERSKALRQFVAIGGAIAIVVALIVAAQGIGGSTPQPSSSAPTRQQPSSSQSTPAQDTAVIYEAQCDAQIKRLQSEQNENYGSYQRAIQEIREGRDALRNKNVVCAKASAILQNMNSFADFVRSSKCSDWRRKREPGISNHLSELRQNFQAVSGFRDRLGC